MKGRVCRLSLVAALLCVTEVFAAPPPTEGAVIEMINGGTRCYKELNYGCAITRLTQARNAVDGDGIQLSPALRIQLLRTLAFALSTVERHGDAQRVFLALFRRAPAERLSPSQSSSSVITDFHKAKRLFLREIAPMSVAPLPLPQPYVPEGPGVGDLVLHLPEDVRLATQVGMDDGPAHTIGFEAGAGLLFGADAQNFGTGFAIGLSYGYSVMTSFQVGMRAGFSQHGTARSDVKAGYPARLLVLNVGPEIRGAFDLSDYVQVAVGVAPSVHASGVGNFGGKIGGLVLGSVTIIARPVKAIGIGVAVLPSVVIAQTADGFGASFTLPISLRLEGVF